VPACFTERMVSISQGRRCLGPRSDLAGAARKRGNDPLAHSIVLRHSDAPVSVRFISSAITEHLVVDVQFTKSAVHAEFCSSFLNTGESSTACFECLALTVGEGEGADLRRTGHCEREFGARHRLVALVRSGEAGCQMG
jgi:hypothetical protein